MPSKPSSKKTRTKAVSTNPKKQSKRSVATKLWLADDKLFHEIASRRDIKPALLLRDIVHDWAVTFRLSPQAANASELEVPVKKFDEQILAEQLRPINQTLATILSQITGLSNSHNSPHTDSNLTPQAQPNLGTISPPTVTAELANIQEQLATLSAFAVAHYMISGQTFINTWAVLQFSQYIAERFLIPEFKNNHQKEATTRRDEARLDALELLQRMSLELGYPASFKPILWTPSE
jgi:hypothetical protein